jgi:hypothetical protein
MCRARPSGSPSSSTTRFRSGLYLTPSTERRAAPGRHDRASAHLVPGPTRPRHRRDRPTTDMSALHAPTATSTTRSSSRRASPVVNETTGGEDVASLEAVHLGGAHIQPVDERYIAKVGGPPEPALGLRLSRARARCLRSHGHRRIARRASASWRRPRQLVTVPGADWLTLAGMTHRPLSVSHRGCGGNEWA